MITDMEKLKRVFDEIGVPYEMTDDSEESSLEENLDTVVLVQTGPESTGPGTSLYFFFERDGSFKELDGF